MRRKLAAITAVDMVGFSRLIERSEEETIARQKEHRIGVFLPKFETFGGTLIKTTGDGYIVEFSSVVDAIRCTIEIQQDIETAEEQFPEDRRILYRIGIHLGDVTIQDMDVYGDGVNVASRIEALADPGGICISDATKKAIQGQSDIKTKYLGESEQNSHYQSRGTDR